MGEYADMARRHEEAEAMEPRLSFPPWTRKGFFMEKLKRLFRWRRS